LQLYHDEKKTSEFAESFSETSYTNSSDDSNDSPQRKLKIKDFIEYYDEEKAPDFTESFSETNSFDDIDGSSKRKVNIEDFIEYYDDEDGNLFHTYRFLCF
jgi:hypothetical protein